MNRVLNTKDFLNKIQSSKRPRILNCSFTFPIVKADKLSLFSKERIPNSTFFDPDEIKDKNSPYPHMLPMQKEFL
jgi:3-mercaptopyruvate sulfurtransferase SseA